MVLCTIVLNQWNNPAKLWTFIAFYLIRHNRIFWYHFTGWRKCPRIAEIWLMYENGWHLMRFTCFISQVGDIPAKQCEFKRWVQAIVSQRLVAIQNSLISIAQVRMDVFRRTCCCVVRNLAPLAMPFHTVPDAMCRVARMYRSKYRGYVVCTVLLMCVFCYTYLFNWYKICERALFINTQAHLIMRLADDHIETSIYMFDERNVPLC